MKEQSCLIKLIVFYDKIASSLGRREEEDIIYLDFSKTFNTVSRNLPVNKLMKYRLGKRRTRLKTA